MFTAWQVATVAVATMSDPNAHETCKRFQEKETHKKRADGLMQAQKHTAFICIIKGYKVFQHQRSDLV